LYSQFHHNFNYIVTTGLVGEIHPNR